MSSNVQQQQQAGESDVSGCRWGVLVPTESSSEPQLVPVLLRSMLESHVLTSCGRISRIQA